MSGDTLFGNEMSYFSGKARAYLTWKGINYTEIAPTPDIMKGEIIANIGWPVIPVLKTAGGQFVQDSADIIAHHEAADTSTRARPDTPLQNFVTDLIQTFADEWLTLPAMHYRWNHNEDWIYTQFGKNALPDGTPEQQYEAGKRAGGRFRGFVPVLGISEQTIPGVEAAYEQFLTDFSAHLETLPYLLGTRPSYADFALYGPLYAHQYRDEWTGEHMRRTAPLVADWVERLRDGADTAASQTGDFLPDDDVPATLLPILKVQMAEQIPVLAKTNDLFAAWAAEADPQAEVPRGFEMIPFVTGGHAGMCMARTFGLFRLQDALQTYTAMSDADRARTDAFLSAIGGDALSGFKLAMPLARRNYRLALA